MNAAARHKDILILGAGGVGAWAARLCAQTFADANIVIADRDASSAAAVADAIGGQAQGVVLDVTDVNALGAILRSRTAVLNCVGPYYRFGVPVLRAAIAAGAFYLDVNDDWQPTLECLALDAEAKATGARAVIGMGASPGLCNLLALAAARAVGEPTALITGWTLDNDPGPPDSAAQAHWLHQSSGKIRVQQGGAFVDVAPLQKMQIDWPGQGSREALSVGHPEAVTLPRTIASLKDCINVMVLHPQLAGALQRVAARIDAGELDVVSAAHVLTSGYVANGEPEPHPAFPGIFALATRDGVAAFAYPRFIRGGDVAEVTARPLVAALEVALTQGLPAGVSTPEQVFEPADVFAALAKSVGIDGPLYEVVVA